MKILKKILIISFLLNGLLNNFSEINAKLDDDTIAIISTEVSALVTVILLALVKTAVQMKSQSNLTVKDFANKWISNIEIVGKEQDSPVSQIISASQEIRQNVEDINMSDIRNLLERSRALTENPTADSAIKAIESYKAIADKVSPESRAQTNKLLEIILTNKKAYEEVMQGRKFDPAEAATIRDRLFKENVLKKLQEAPKTERVRIPELPKLVEAQRKAIEAQPGIEAIRRNIELTRKNIESAQQQVKEKLPELAKEKAEIEFERYQKEHGIKAPEFEDIFEFEPAKEEEYMFEPLEAFKGRI